MKNILSVFQWHRILFPGSDVGISPECLETTHIHSVLCDGIHDGQPVDGCMISSELAKVLSDAVWQLDGQFKVISCNEAAKSLYFGSSENVVGRAIDDVLPLFIEESVQGQFTSTSPPSQKKNRLFYRNNTGRFTLLKVFVFIRYGQPNEIEGYTVLVKPDHSLTRDRVSDVQWHYLFETYPEPIAVISDSTFIYVNAACADLYGASHKDELIGKSLFEFALVPYHKLVRKRLEIIASGERTTPIESRIRRLDGHVRYVRTYSVPIEYGGKKAAQIVISDITEQKRALRALERSEKRFKALFERAGIGILLATHDARILETNPSFQRMVGYSSDELRDMSTDDLTHQEDFPIQAQFYRQIHEGKIDRYRLEKRYMHKDNYVVWGSLTMAVIRDESGAVEYMIGMVEDLSERKRTEQELLLAINEAEEMTLLKSSFLTNMSHEIRTPLTGIMGFASILQDELSPAQAEIVRLIEQSGKRLLKTLDAILDLSMLESGTMPFEPRRVNVVDEVLHQIHLTEEAAQEKGLYLKVDYKSVDIFCFFGKRFLIPCSLQPDQ